MHVDLEVREACRGTEREKSRRCTAWTCSAPLVSRLILLSSHTTSQPHQAINIVISVFNFHSGKVQPHALPISAGRQVVTTVAAGARQVLKRHPAHRPPGARVCAAGSAATWSWTSGSNRWAGRSNASKTPKSSALPPPPPPLLLDWPSVPSSAVLHSLRLAFRQQPAARTTLTSTQFGSITQQPQHCRHLP